MLPHLLRLRGAGGTAHCLNHPVPNYFAHKSTCHRVTHLDKDVRSDQDSDAHPFADLNKDSDSHRGSDLSSYK